MNRTESKRLQVVAALKNLNSKVEQSSLTVCQIMTHDPRCIRQETNLLELIRMFHAWQFRHLLVLDANERLAGVLSDRDVLRCLGPSPQPKNSLLAGITAGQIMSTDVVTIDRNATVEQAVGLLLDHGINCLPVLDDGRLVGILTNTDLSVMLQVFLETMRSSPTEEPVETA